MTVEDWFYSVMRGDGWMSDAGPWSISGDGKGSLRITKGDVVYDGSFCAMSEAMAGFLQHFFEKRGHK